MSILADKIEQFILTKLLEEQEGITLRRNELAETLDCAPSQISYVLSTRFSNDRGFIVQSRRGLGGSITITRVMEPVRTQVLIPLEKTKKRNEEEPVITIGHIDQVLFQHMKEARITKREAAMLHEAFVRILQDVPVERRKEAAERFYQAIMNIVNEEV
ncbi:MULTISPECIES: CtsR family transcriptional regulator [unclassified Veillonella]|uniref:CtsR family transcriptional regulator n=1 Tax=unclassified Veillonella TaxID=2630086 RepID=UPI000F8F25E3|nr:MULTISPECIES: CtsR family transcriptional regulator [unclassified Veillonella]